MPMEPQPRFDSLGVQPGQAPPALKIFVGGLSQETTRESLNAYFSAFGFVDCYLMKDGATGRSRGFAFANFQDELTMNAVLGAEHIIDGTRVTVAPYGYNKGGGKGAPAAALPAPAPAALPAPEISPTQLQQVQQAAGALETLKNQLQALLLVQQLQATGQQAAQQQQLQEQQRLLEQQQQQEQLQLLTQQAQQLQQQAQQQQQLEAQQRLEQQQHMQNLQLLQPAPQPLDMSLAPTTNELKIFVGGLSQDTTRESLTAYFSQFGYADGYLMKDGMTGRSRGFGFVNFNDKEAVNTVLSLQHQVDGVNVTVSPYKGPSGGRPPMAAPGPPAAPQMQIVTHLAPAAPAPAPAPSADLGLPALTSVSSAEEANAALEESGLASSGLEPAGKSTKVQINDLPSSATDDTIMEAYKIFQPVACVLIRDSAGRSAVVEFSTPSIAQLALNQPPVIDGIRLDVSEYWDQGLRDGRRPGGAYRASPY